MSPFLHLTFQFCTASPTQTQRHPTQFPLAPPSVCRTPFTLPVPGGDMHIPCCSPSSPSLGGCLESPRRAQALLHNLQAGQSPALRAGKPPPSAHGHKPSAAPPALSAKCIREGHATLCAPLRPEFPGCPAVRPVATCCLSVGPGALPGGPASPPPFPPWSRHQPQCHSCGCPGLRTEPPGCGWGGERRGEAGGGAERSFLRRFLPPPCPPPPPAAP